MTMFIRTWALLLTLVLGGAVLADEPPSRRDLANAALTRLNPVRANGELLVNWRGNRPTPVRVGGFRWAAPEGVTGVDIAKAFLNAHPELVGVGPDQLVLESTKAARERVAYRFEQRWQGLEVVGGEVVVLTVADGTVISLADETVPLNLTDDVSISANSAVDAAWLAVTGSRPSAAGLERTVANGMARKVVLARGGEAKLAYRVVVPTIPLLEKWVVFVDAHSGMVVQKQNEVIQ
jgi:hypothetical protein